MSKNKNSGLDQYGAGRFEQQQSGAAGVERVKPVDVACVHFLICTSSVITRGHTHKIYRPGSSCPVRVRFFANRVIDA